MPFPVQQSGIMLIWILWTFRLSLGDMFFKKNSWGEILQVIPKSAYECQGCFFLSSFLNKGAREIIFIPRCISPQVFLSYPKF